MLDEGNPSERKAMHLLVALGDIYGAEGMVPITWAHVAGASYKTVGGAGLGFIEEFSRDTRVRVRTTVNPLGMDEQRWRDHGIPSAFAQAQSRIVEAYRRMGVEESWTCIPYISQGMPALGEHMAWAESSAALMANSVAGARTNREAGPSALAAAVTGWTPTYGLHLEEGRRPNVTVRVEADVEDAEYGLLGCALGPLLEGGIPYIDGIHPDMEEVRFLAAALGSTSDCAMFHIPGLTPEASRERPPGLERLTIGPQEIKDVKGRLTTGEAPDLIVFGCPQVSPVELRRIADALAAGKPGAPVWVFTSRSVAAAETVAVKSIETQGGRVILDTCPEVTPLELFAKCTACPSGKAAVYLPTLCKQRFRWGRLEDLLGGRT